MTIAELKAARAAAIAANAEYEKHVATCDRCGTLSGNNRTALHCLRATTLRAASNEASAIRGGKEEEAKAEALAMLEFLTPSKPRGRS